jgi:tRNA threonylcarbamoyladenosine biosynthesis protein TsaE
VADLGGGKTTFVRGLARGLKSKDEVSSPTFTLNCIYKCKNGLEIHHFDFYRLNELGILADQLAESLNDEKVITIIEWSGIVSGVLPKKRLTIKFTPDEKSSESRSIQINYPESMARPLIGLETSWTEVRP